MQEINWKIYPKRKGSPRNEFCLRMLKFRQNIKLNKYHPKFKNRLQTFRRLHKNFI